MFFIDNLRILLIIMVLLWHMAATYGAPGFWPYQEVHRLDGLTSLAYTLLSVVNGPYVLGFFYLLAGYFTPRSYDRKGPGPFFRDRLLRLGIPMLIYVFIFDPLILYPGWEDGYEAVIDALFTAINAHRIAWISLGSLRFPLALKEIIQKRFPQTKIIYDEFITGRDGKLRYPKPLRLQIFNRIVRILKKAGGEKIPVYFCMESGDIWNGVQKKTPRNKKEVEKLLTLPLGANEKVF